LGPSRALGLMKMNQMTLRHRRLPSTCRRFYRISSPERSPGVATLNSQIEKTRFGLCRAAALRLRPPSRGPRQARSSFSPSRDLKSEIQSDLERCGSESAIGNIPHMGQSFGLRIIPWQWRGQGALDLARAAFYWLRLFRVVVGRAFHQGRAGITDAR